MLPFVRVGRVSVITVILLSVGLLNHVIILPLLLDAAGRDAWLSILIAAVIMLAWLWIVYRIVRDIGLLPLPEWLQKRGGKGSRFIVIACFSVMLFLSAGITTVDTMTWGTSTYLPQTPMAVTASVFMILCLFAAYQGLHVIVYMSCILLPVVCALGVFVASGNISEKDYTQLLPILEHGTSPLWNGTVIASSGLVELLIFVILQGYANKPFKRIHLYATGLFVVVLGLGPTVAALAEFGVVEATALRFPAFAQWRLLMMGKYVEHLDFFAIFQWLSGAFVRTSSSLCLMLDMLQIRTPRKRTLTLIGFGTIFVIASAYPFGDAVQYHLYGLFRPSILIVMIVLSLFMLVLSMLKRRRGDEHAADRP